MKNETKILIGVLVFTVTVIVLGVFLLSRNTPNITQTNEGIVYNIDYSKGQKSGSDSAKVKVVEFSDFQCPACKAADPVVESILQERNPNVQFIYRHFPLAQHLNAKTAAQAAIAAGEQNKFWEMHQKLFETQEQWSNLDDSKGYFVKLAKDLGLDEQKIKEAIEKNTYAQIIQEDLSEGAKLNVNATPTFYLNGRKLELGNFADIKIEIDKALKR